ncbi:MAG TPA: pyridoxal phosphate-dependent aminotransferase family protein, partial [Planctomycetaceae bacterium]|nr:pyridoxal phosphate-dependent aminotransferase family protein [Planctomycetaceae bacterium]
LKQLQFQHCGPNREIQINGQPLINFGFDSFLGLDQDPRVIEAVARGAREWGTQFGASRAFAVAGIEAEVEQKIARWMGTEAAVIFPSVTLTNVGVIPGLVGTPDLIVVDEFAHNSILEGTKIAKANGVRVLSFQHNSADDLERVLMAAKPYRCAVVAIDGVYSMSGVVADLPALNEVALRHSAVLYVDDAHATAVMDECGRGTVLESLGSYDNTLVVGCFSKACSVFGAFVACTREFQRLIKMKSSTFIFGGPVPPPYLAGVSTVIDILMSDDYAILRERLDNNLHRMVDGLETLNLALLGGRSAIISVLIGDEENTFRAGWHLSERGFHVQSVTFPAVPYHAGVIRIQVNANHRPEDIDGLLNAIAELKEMMDLPDPDQLSERAEFGSDNLMVA